MARRRRLDADTVEIVTPNAATPALETRVAGDAHPRVRIIGSSLATGDGTTAPVASSASPLIVYRKQFAIGDGTGGTTTAAQFLAGVTLFTPAVGDLILQLAVDVTTAFDGTTPVADFGTFVGSDTGFIVPSQTGPIYLDGESTPLGGTGLVVGYSYNDWLWIGAQLNGQGLHIRATAANPVKIVASQDGTKTGDPLDSTVGAFTAYAVVLTSAGMTDL